ncbi:MAG TPA: hypothetical protein V6C86_00630 [Oculatellaceae cyanobacterium]|jgi:hypothetical protein
MGCYTFAVGVSSVICLALGYLSVFGKSGRFRFRCALSYVLVQTCASVLALFERAEFLRLIDAGIIWIAMVPILSLWLIVLRQLNRRKLSQKSAEMLSGLTKTPEIESKVLAAAKK